MSNASVPVLVLCVAALAACASRSAPATADPAVAEAAIRATARTQPLRVVFDWRIQERDARFSGSGAARLQGDRARLDLFGPTGDGYLSAALVGHDVRLPPGVDAPQLPPPALFWGALGVVSPPPTATLEGTRETDGRTELYYRAADGVLRYELVDGRVAGVELDGERNLVLEVQGWTPEGLPVRSHYRDLDLFTELIMEVEDVMEVRAHPPEIWRPGRE